MQAVAVWLLLVTLSCLTISSAIVPAEKCNVRTPLLFWVAVPPAMKLPVAITLQTGGPALVDVLANAESSGEVDAPALSVIISVGEREAASVAVTAKISLRTWV